MSRLLSIVLPVYNQGDHIAPIVESYVRAFEKVQTPREFILVVNACRDNSLEICEELARRFPEVRVLHSDTGGWGHAVRLGLAAAQGDLLCYTNSARTAPQDLILLSLYAIANPDSVIKAHRRSRENLTRRIGSLLWNMCCRLWFDLPGWDINATPKVFTRTLYETIQLSEQGDLIDLEFNVKCRDAGKIILEVPIYAALRHGGASTTNWGTAFGLFRGAWRARRAYLRNGQWPAPENGR
jgi:glycosyltransferase involved in cell wall biosynthesis